MKRNKAAYFIVGIAVFILLLQLPFFNNIRDGIRSVIMAPVRMIDGGYRKTDHLLSTIGNINNLSKENADLKEKNTQLQADLAKLLTVQSENDQLKKDLNFNSTRSDLTFIPASIVTFSPTGLYGVFIIDKGKDDGIIDGQAVVNGGFLVGKISGVSDKTYEVWLITSRNVTIPVMLAKTQTTGLLRGGISGLVINNIPLDTAIQKGDPVVTSALENLFPPGLAVGTIEEVISKKEDIFLSVRIASPVNIGTLTNVFVVKK